LFHLRINVLDGVEFQVVGERARVGFDDFFPAWGGMFIWKHQG